MSRVRSACVLALFGAVLVWPRAALAVDLPKVAGTAPRLDVTETFILAQRFKARVSEGEDPREAGYGVWLNRLNVALRYKRITVGTRLDSSLYWLRPEDASDLDPAQRENTQRDGTSRFRDKIYPAKLWLTYQSPNLEVTVGDAYVQFGRGLVLTMRKIDELGIDNTVRGGKVTWNEDPFSVTLVGGLANPNRVDEVSGRALFLPRAFPGDTSGPQPLYGSDRIVGAQLEAGRGLPVVLSTHVARITRCAPYKYDALGRVIDGPLDAPFGSCEPNDTRTWLSALPTSSPALNASEVLNAGQSLEIPTLWGHGRVYVEAAVQRRHSDDHPNDPNSNGNALYAAASANYGPITHTLEVKSYRNFHATPAAVDITRAVAMNNILYSAQPTAEIITTDTQFGFFNVCVDGGRMRTDLRTSEKLLLYATGAYFYTRSEETGGGCNEYGNTVTTNSNPDAVHNDVFDGVGGFEWRFDNDRSHFFFSAGARDDTKRSGEFFYNELHAEYAFEKHLTGPISFAFNGRHRLRKQENQNLRGGDLAGSVPHEEPWREGEHYTSLKIAPKWTLAQGVEYTTRLGLPTYYFNGSFLYRFSGESNIRALVGQQRGGLKCVSGVCKIFPPFEGARIELTLRF